MVKRDDLDPVSVSGIWRHLAASELSLTDLAVLAAAQGDAYATNALLEATGIEAITRRMVDLGMRRSALLDRVRDERGPDDAPHVSLGTTREYATLMSDLVGGRAVNPAVSAQVSEWLTIGQDLSLVGAATNLRAFGHDDDAHGLLFLNRTAYDDTGVRAEAGVIAGPRRPRLRAHGVLRRRLCAASRPRPPRLPHARHRADGERALTRVPASA